MSRAKPRGNTGRYGLFDNPGTDDAEAEENPLLRRCPACHAAPRQPCTKPARGGRRRLTGYHPSRQPPQETEQP